MKRVNPKQFCRWDDFIIKFTAGIVIGLDRAIIAGIPITPIEDIIPGSRAARTDRDDDDIQVDNPTGGIFVKDQGRVTGRPAEIIDNPFQARNRDDGSIRRTRG